MLNKGHLSDKKVIKNVIALIFFPHCSKPSARLKAALENHFNIFLLPDHHQPPTNPEEFSVHALLLFNLFQSKIAEDSACDFIHSNTLPSLILLFKHPVALIIVDSLCGC